MDEFQHRELRTRILDLHRELLAAARRDHERVYGRHDATEFFRALTEHDELAWLRPTTTVVARLDAALDKARDPGDPDAAAQLAHAIADVAATFRADVDGEAFARRYAELLDRSPDLALAHARAAQTLDAAAP